MSSAAATAYRHMLAIKTVPTARASINNVTCLLIRHRSWTAAPCYRCREGCPP